MLRPCNRDLTKLRRQGLRKGGGGENSTNFCTGRLLPRFHLLPFYIPFFTKKVPLSYTFIDKWCPFHIQSTLALGTLRCYGHPANADESRPPDETHKEMTETNSLTRKWGQSLSCPQARHFTCFFFLLAIGGHLSSSKILTHIT